MAELGVEVPNGDLRAFDTTYKSSDYVMGDIDQSVVGELAQDEDGIEADGSDVAQDYDGDDLEEDAGRDPDDEAADDLDDAHEEEQDEGSEEDGENSGSANEEADEEEHVGAVKIPKGQEEESDSDVAVEDGPEDSESDAGEALDGSESTASSEVSGAAEDWDEVSGADGDADVANRNNCVYCGQDEEHDPSEEFEEYLACSVCGDNGKFTNLVHKPTAHYTDVV